MHLHGLCYYRSGGDGWQDAWRRADYAAMNLVKAVKGLPFGGNSQVTYAGTVYPIDNTAEGRARALFIATRALVGKLQAAGYQSASLVPVPSSAHVNPTANFTGRKIVDAIHTAQPSFVAAPCLYFNEAIPPARGGGTRNPDIIQSHLRLAPPAPTTPVVLIDDVCTSGGHLIAAARFLRQQGIDVEDAFVIGRTKRERPASMWAVATETLDVEDLFNF